MESPYGIPLSTVRRPSAWDSLLYCVGRPPGISFLYSASAARLGFPFSTVRRPSAYGIPLSTLRGPSPYGIPLSSVTDVPPTYHYNFKTVTPPVAVQKLSYGVVMDHPYGIPMYTVRRPFLDSVLGS